jgi:coenzyme F420-reducing hydrogenase delta subunit
MNTGHSVQRLKVVIFTCNWNAYSGMEAAGKDHRYYSAAVRPIRVPCLGRLHPGLILKAFERGADGVMMLGCPPDDCHYDFGNHGAETVFSISRELLGLLGFHKKQLQLAYIAAEDGNAFVDNIEKFMSDLFGTF